jgi:hypothetical protein
MARGQGAGGRLALSAVVGAASRREGEQGAGSREQGAIADGKDSFFEENKFDTN